MNLDMQSILQDAELDRLAMLSEALPCSGRLDDWQVNVSRACVGNSALTFAVSCAFAAPFLDVLEFPSEGFHFYGGKLAAAATCTDVAASVWGSGHLVRNWGQWPPSATGPEVWAGLHLMGNLASAEPASVGQALLAKSISVPGDDTNECSRPALFISSGECSFIEYRNANSMDVNEPSTVMMLDIPLANLPRQDGARNLRSNDQHTGFYDAVSSKADEYYGTPIAAFFPLVAGLRVAQVKAIIDCNVIAFLDRTDYQNAGDVGRGVIAYFSLVAAIGELASALNVTGWEEGEAIEAGFACYQAWLENNGSQLAH